MATFSSLDQVGSALATRLLDEIDPDPGGGILVGAPPDDPATITEGLRLTLLWVTPQPYHRNDPWERGPDGRRTPPPLTLSVSFLLTAYGTTEEPLRAMELLGRALQVLHSTPTLSLPDDTSDATGDGPLNVVIVPTELETMERIFTPLGVPHRPWALLEVGPVQLAHLAAAAPAPAIVVPGGVRLGGHVDGDLTTISPPRIVRVTPERPGGGARVRIDVTRGPITQVWVAGVAATNLVEREAGSVYTAELPLQVSAGRRPLRVQVGDTTTPTLPVQFSDVVEIEVLEDGSSWIEAPEILTLSAADALTLRGEGLLTADAVMIWPEAGARGPGELLVVPATPTGDTRVDLAAGSILAAADADHPVPTGLCRLAARVFVEMVPDAGGTDRPRYRYTTPVLLELLP